MAGKNDKVIVTKDPNVLYTGMFPNKNSGNIARTDNEQIKKLKTFKNVKFIEDAWGISFSKSCTPTTERDAEYTGKRNHVTEES